MIKKLPYIAFGLFILFLIMFPFFVKVRIECQSQYGKCPPDIVSKLQNMNDKSLFLARLGESGILKKDFLVSDFSSQFKLPNVLLVNILVKKPEFSIFDKSTGKYTLVDNAGTIISFSDSSGLPTLIKDNQGGKVGDSVSDQDIFALKLIQGVNEMYQVGGGMIQNDTLVVDLPAGVRVLFPLEGIDSQVLLGSLRLIYVKITTDFPGKYSQIDMRYKNPILR